MYNQKGKPTDYLSAYSNEIDVGDMNDSKRRVTLFLSICLVL